MFFTHWGWDKMAALFHTTFSNAFSSMEVHKFWLRFHWSLFPKSNYQYCSIGSNNGLAPSRRQAIIWTNGGYICVNLLQWVRALLVVMSQNNDTWNQTWSGYNLRFMSNIHGLLLKLWIITCVLRLSQNFRQQIRYSTWHLGYDAKFRHFVVITKPVANYWCLFIVLFWETLGLFQYTGCTLTSICWYSHYKDKTIMRLFYF